MPKAKQFMVSIVDIESGAYYTAAEVLLIGLRHIKEHQMSHPVGLSPEEWNEIVDKLIWLMEFLTEKDQRDGILGSEEDQKQYQEASELLGKYFSHIWC
jgi:hypothetical protein